MVIINSFRYPESNIKYQQRNVRAILDKKDLGVGTLYISESTLAWQKTENTGFTVSYPDISLHAISKDESLYSQECLYVMLDGHVTMPGEVKQSEETAEDSDDEQSTADVSEVLLVPEENPTEAIRNMYETIKVCQELNPDPNMSDDDDDDEDDHLYEDAEDMEEGEYQVQERGGGDADVDHLTHRLEGNAVNISFYNYTNGSNNDDEEFQDAD